MTSQIRRIKEWRLFHGKKPYAIFVEGFVEGVDYLWRSTTIEYRENPRTLRTQNNGTYELIGGINWSMCAGNGFSTEIIDEFRDGFPANWKEILFPELVIHQSITTPVRRNKILSSKEKKALVTYSPSDSEYGSFDDESFDEIETGNTPILPSRRTTQHVNKRLRIWESSPEEDVEKKENERRKRSHKSTSKPDVPSKKPKKSEPPQGKGLLALRNVRERLEIRSPIIDIDEPQPIIEYPASEMSFDMNENKENDVPKVRRWTAKEKQKFLEHLKLYNPVNDQDWEQVQSNKTDVPRNIEELKEKAEEFGWEPYNSKAENWNISKAFSMNPITAHPGTVSHIMQAEQFNQQYLTEMNKNCSAAVNHRKQMLAASDVPPIELSESVIDFARTPENLRRFRANRNLFNPSVMTANFSTSSMNDSSTSNASVSSPFVPPMDKTSRQRQQLHAYQTFRKTQKVTKKTGQETIVFSEETTTMTMSFLFPQLPSRRPGFSNDLEETTDNDDLEDQDDDVFGETF